MIGVLVTLLVTGLSPSPAQSTNLRRKVYRLIERTRERHGLPALHLDRDLSRYCRRHTRQMVSQNRLFHSTDLVGKVRRYNANWWGENVGYAQTAKRLRYLWMHSPGHRANILNRHFHHIGVGVVRGRGWVWSTTIFYG
ncbi:MAG: hypothetical protein H0W82_07725 [Actinobacteria bacterium]|nr:hypothetical protein [Actinomycetota bacterium]